MMRFTSHRWNVRETFMAVTTVVNGAWVPARQIGLNGW
jgi:hypothetical protein